MTSAINAISTTSGGGTEQTGSSLTFKFFRGSAAVFAVAAAVAAVATVYFYQGPAVFPFFHSATSLVLPVLTVLAVEGCGFFYLVSRLYQSSVKPVQPPVERVSDEEYNKLVDNFNGLRAQYLSLLEEQKKATSKVRFADDVVMGLPD